MEHKILTIEELHFAYNNKEVLCSINLEIEKNDFFVLSGDNGSGKSTLLKLILGFLDANIGRIHLNTKHIGYISQEGLTKLKDFPASVYEVIAMRLKEVNFFNINSGKISSKVCDALKLVEIEDLKNKRISDLSGGQLQRVLIARELVGDLELLLLDEPTNGLDQKSIKSLMELLTKLNQKGLTIGMVSHHIEDIKSNVGKIYELKNKHISEVKV